MKIAVVLPCNLYAAPFYRRYESILSNNNIGFDLIYWNRAQIEEESKGNALSLNIKDEVLSGNKTKIVNYVRFALFVKKQLEIGKYDKVFFLGSYAGVMGFLSIYLKKNYKNKYWLDIRDYSFENFKPYFIAMGIAIDNSYATSISSPGFRTFLPEHSYNIVHNIDWINIEKTRNMMELKEQSEIIRISYIGLVGFYEENKKLINVLKNDTRFRLQYYGANSEKLNEYCKSHNIKNVDFHGRFKPEETAKFYLKTDIINNVYGNDNINIRTALSNKLYFATALQMPILVSPNTFMSQLATSYGFGFILNYDDASLADKLYKWYMEFSETRNFDGFSKFWDKAKNDDMIFEEKVLKFLEIENIYY